MRRTHKYADGGKIVSDHTGRKVPRYSGNPRPGLGGALKDAGEAIVDAIAPRSIKHSKKRTDEAIDKAGG